MIATLRVLSPIIAVLYIIASGLLLYDLGCEPKILRSLALKLWVWHITFYWCVVTISIVTTGRIVYPHGLTATWAAIIAFQGAFTIIAAFIIRKRQGTNEH